MRYTLLKMTQLILSAMDSDEVNSIGDTTEAQQVVDVIETTYNDLVSTIDFPDHWDFFELQASGDITRPTLMTLPSDVGKLEWVQYDNNLASGTVRKYEAVSFMPRSVFFKRMNGLDSASSDVYSYQLQVDTGTFDVRGKNNVHPKYYTTMDDRTLVFDNYVESEHDTLTGNRTHCYGMRIPEFTRDDDFIPDLEPRHFTLLLNEAKAQASAEIKQVSNPKAEQRARKGWVQAHRKSPQTQGTIYERLGPDFGRR